MVSFNPWLNNNLDPVRQLSTKNKNTNLKNVSCFQGDGKNQQLQFNTVFGEQQAEGVMGEGSQTLALQGGELNQLEATLKKSRTSLVRPFLGRGKEIPDY